MKLEKGMLASLSDGKQYIVISSIMINNMTYVYLVENEKLNNMKFCIEEIENDRLKLTEVKDVNLRQVLLREFVNQFYQE